MPRPTRSSCSPSDISVGSSIRAPSRRYPCREGPFVETDPFGRDPGTRPGVAIAAAPGASVSGRAGTGCLVSSAVRGPRTPSSVAAPTAGAGSVRTGAVPMPSRNTKVSTVTTAAHPRTARSFVRRLILRNTPLDS